MDIKVHLHTSVMLNKRVRLVESCLFFDSIHSHLVLKAPVGLNVIKKLLKIIIIKSSFQTMKMKKKTVLVEGRSLTSQFPRSPRS